MATAKTCSEADCDAPVHGQGLCSRHYRRIKRQDCSIDGCDRRTAGRGWCATHYARWRKHGNPQFTLRGRRVDIADRLLAHTDRRGPDECWPWTGAIDPRGYGRAQGGSGSSGLAHRLTHEAFVGPIPVGYEIDHMCHLADECRGGPSCPHRRCCNPSHLKPSIPVDNLMRGNSPSAINARRTECTNGHPFTPENTTTTKAGRRACRTCRNAWKRADWAKKTQAATT